MRSPNHCWNTEPVGGDGDEATGGGGSPSTMGSTRALPLLRCSATGILPRSNFNPNRNPGCPPRHGGKIQVVAHVEGGGRRRRRAAAEAAVVEEGGHLVSLAAREGFEKNEVRLRPFVMIMSHRGGPTGTPSGPRGAIL